MNHPAFVRRVLALVLTAAVAVAAALPGFAVYAMPIQTAYPQESIYLFDADTGEALVEQNPDMVRHVASLTKMMTALLVIENGSDLNASITIPDSLTPEFQSIKANRGHAIGLQAGESVRRIDLLYAMPGSCGRCYTGPNTYGILTLDKGRIVHHEHKEVPHP